jgi:hypothetical protein
MVEIAESFHLHGPAYRAKCGDRMLPSHLRVRQDIAQCRTEALGGQLYHCAHCQAAHYRYHSCKNRHCPKCQTAQADVWLEQQKSLLLPVPYFMVTCPLPEPLRALTRSHQKRLYTLLCRSSAEAIQALADGAQVHRGPGRDGGCLAYLDPRPARPSACALHRDGRWLG